ncbi:MAG: hypothetical protein KKD99_08685 [Proteobacteria bacterium]|nr:hypothetical protein [Pseudomonadota bacterium]
MRKSLTAIFPLWVFLVLFCLAHPSQASAPSLVGVWKGTAQRITPQGCSSLPLTVQVARQCGRLVSGTVQVEGKTLIFVGRIKDDLSINFHGGTKISTVEIDNLSLTGSYSASPTPRITVTEFSFYNNYPGNDEYDVFQTPFWGPIKTGGMVPFMLLLGE